MNSQVKKIILSILVAVIVSIIAQYIMNKINTIGKLKPIKKFQSIRGCDSQGCGHYGASRGSRAHKGIDIVVNEGDSIKSPISGKVTRFPQPYASDPKYKGIEIVGDTYKVKIFYCIPNVQINTIVKAGQTIAAAQNISEKYTSGMTNHVHLEVYTLAGQVVDPAPLFS